MPPASNGSPAKPPDPVSPRKECGLHEVIGSPFRFLCQIRSATVAFQRRPLWNLTVPRRTRSRTISLRTRSRAISLRRRPPRGLPISLRTRCGTTTLARGSLATHPRLGQLRFHQLAILVAIEEPKRLPGTLLGPFDVKTHPLFLGDVSALVGVDVAELGRHLMAGSHPRPTRGTRSARRTVSGRTFAERTVTIAPHRRFPRPISCGLLLIGGPTRNGARQGHRSEQRENLRVFHEGVNNRPLNELQRFFSSLTPQLIPSPAASLATSPPPHRPIPTAGKAWAAPR
jgi:hypothetical protein